MNNNHQLIKKQVAAALNEALNDPNRDTGRVELDTFIKEIIKNKHEEQNKKKHN